MDINLPSTEQRSFAFGLGRRLVSDRLNIGARGRVRTSSLRGEILETKSSPVGTKRMKSGIGGVRSSISLQQFPLKVLAQRAKYRIAAALREDGQPAIAIGWPASTASAAVCFRAARSMRRQLGRWLIVCRWQVEQRPEGAIQHRLKVAMPRISTMSMAVSAIKRQAAAAQTCPVSVVGHLAIPQLQQGQATKPSVGQNHAVPERYWAHSSTRPSGGIKRADHTK